MGDAVIKPNLNVVELPVCNVNDLPVALRNLADGIEHGEYQDLKEIVVVARGNTMRIFRIGKVDPSDCYLLLGAAQRQIERGIMP
jgi:hypothetical protein